MSKAGPSLEDRQRRVLEAWIQNPKKTYPEIAEIGGVSDATFYRYRQDPEFMARYHAMCNKRFKSMEALAIQALKEQMKDGNFQAVKYLLDGLGYKPTEKIDANVSADQNVVITIEE